MGIPVRDKFPRWELADREEMEGRWKCKWVKGGRNRWEGPVRSWEWRWSRRSAKKKGERDQRENWALEQNSQEKSMKEEERPRS